MPQTGGDLLYGQDSGAPWQTDVVPTELRQVAYTSFPLLTHPIDMVTGKQGWGPFAGSWQPVQFIDPAQNISAAYSGSNTWLYGPGYQNITLLDDPSESRADNSSLWSVIKGALGQAQSGSSSTIAQSPYISAASQRVRSILGLES